MDLQPLIHSVESTLHGNRLRHTFSVETCCVRLAAIYGFSEKQTQKLRIAALLHDITKELDFPAQMALCKQYGLSPTKEECAAPKTLHAITGAALARDRYAAYTDEEICEAIRVHTVGKAGMSCFDKLLYLADFIEDTRTYEDCVRLREFFYHGISQGIDPFLHLDRTMIYSFDLTIALLLKESAIIAPQSCAARNDLLIQIAH